MKCLYRNWSKCNNTFTVEHVLPQSIGGNIKPINPFTINNVCVNCNNLAGIFIDGPFVRSFFTQSNRALFALKYIDIESKPTIPLTYMGTLTNYMYESKICEVWLGPTGDSIFNFHDPYPQYENYPSYIGEPLNMCKTKIDDGFTFLFIRSNNPQWHPIIFNSFAFHFRNSINYLGNGPTPNGGNFFDIPKNLINLRDELREKLKSKLQVTFKVDTNFGHRFLAKIALGFGQLLLKEEFVESSSANNLRKLMWEKNPEQLNDLNIRGMDFFQSVDRSHTSKIFWWEGGHSIFIIKQKEGIFLHINLYESNISTIQLTDNPGFLDCDFEDGFFYVVVPSLQRAVGPKSLHKFLAHKDGHVDLDLKKLEQEMSKYENRPPFDLNVAKNIS